jgi:hypothetical protein
MTPGAYGFNQLPVVSGFGTTSAVEVGDDFQQIMSLVGAGTYPWNMPNVPAFDNIVGSTPWGGPGIFAAVDYAQATDDFQGDLSIAGTLYDVYGGSYWLADGSLASVDYTYANDDFQADAVGTYATLSGGYNWGGTIFSTGTLFTNDYPVVDNDDFQSYQTNPGVGGVVPSGGTITTLAGGNGWAAGGTFVSPT